MEKYLTRKCRPGKGVKLLENMALLAGFGLFVGCVAFTVLAVMTFSSMGGLELKNFLLLIPAALAALAMNPIGERIRARKHAQVIVTRLHKAGGCIPADEAEAAIGVRRAAETAMALVDKGYLTGIRLEQGFLLLEEAAVQLPQKEAVKQLFRDAEG